MWTAILAMHFVRDGDISDTFEIAEILLDRHAADMPRTLLRYAMEHLDKKQREHYGNLK